MIDPTAPLTDAEHLKVGDVVQIAVKLSRPDGDFWWKRFAVVYEKNKRDRLAFMALNLKMEPNIPDSAWAGDDRKSDLREIDLRDRRDEQVVTWLPPEKWPQGVVAMHMKYVLMRIISIEGEE